MNLTQQDLLDMYHQMVLTRRLGEMFFTLYRELNIIPSSRERHRLRNR